MAENAIYKIEKNESIARDVLIMRLLGPTGSLVAPGQFVNISLPGFYLRRPISVCRWGDGWLDIIYKVLGKGTARMSQFAPGTELDLLCGLGNGFTVAAGQGKNVVLVGGGVGVPPLYALAQQLAKGGTPPAVVLGFASAPDVFFNEEFEALGCKVHIATEDGTLGDKGYVTVPLARLAYNYYYTCGPTAMLKAVFKMGADSGAAGQMSFEERMGCGFGVCMGCTCKTQLGPKRVCVDGPVFTDREVMFE